jgi:hypothetical protein
MTLVHRRVQSLEKSPRPPLSKGEREAPGDLSEQIKYTNLVWSDLAVVVQQVFVQSWVMVCAVLLRTRRFFMIPSTLVAVSIIPTLATSAQ